MAVDAIFTGPGQGMCCLAIGHGFAWGINSSSGFRCAHHPVTFVDNDFKAYNHHKHLETVKELRPKYVTVRDAMTAGQCKREGIEYFPLEQILNWAAELAEHAQHVIVIPKYDCLDQIPETFLVGYAVPTSYGATSLPYSVFGTRAVHLLGGSWSQQHDLLLHSEMNVVSLDFNHCHKLAMHGLFNDPQGYNFKLAQALPSFSDNPRWTCMALSLAAIRRGLNEYEPRAIRAKRVEQTSSPVDDLLRSHLREG